MSEIQSWYHLNNPETGATFFTAIPADPPAMYPKSLGEECLEMWQDKLSHYRAIEADRFVPGVRVIRWDINWILFNGVRFKMSVHPSDCIALRRAMWHDERAARLARLDGDLWKGIKASQGYVDDLRRISKESIGWRPRFGQAAEFVRIVGGGR